VNAVIKLRRSDKKGIFLSNNSTLSRQEYVKKMEKLGIKVSIDEVFNSGCITAQILKKNNWIRAYVIGKQGLLDELASAGVKVVNKGDVDCVVVGLDRKFNYGKLSKAMLYVKNCAKFVATNLDSTLPLAKFEIPGAGALVAALEFCTGVKPYLVIGKPSPVALDFIIRKYRLLKDEIVMVGDRLDTDVQAAYNAGIDSILALTSAARKENLLSNYLKPTFVLEDLLGMFM